VQSAQEDYLLGEIRPGVAEARSHTHELDLDEFAEYLTKLL
jgi:hypothetical protein